MGDTLRVMGILDKSSEILQQSLAIAKKLNSPNEVTLALLGLGNTSASQNDTKLALDYYQEVINTSDIR